MPTSSLPMTGCIAMTFSAPRAFSRAARSRAVRAGSLYWTGVDSFSSTVTVAALSGGRPAEVVMPAAICCRPSITRWRLVAVKERVGEFELDLVGDDVALGAAVDVADGDDGWVLGILFAADDGLDLRDVERGEGDGIAAELRSGAVAADAVDDDIDGGGAGHGVAREETDLARGQFVRVVQADDDVGLAEALVEMVGEHGLGAVDGLLRRLADEHERAVPLVLRRRPWRARCR